MGVGVAVGGVAGGGVAGEVEGLEVVGVVVPPEAVVVAVGPAVAQWAVIFSPRKIVSSVGVPLTHPPEITVHSLVEVGVAGTWLRPCMRPVTKGRCRPCSPGQTS